MLIAGIHAVEEALREGKTIEKVLVGTQSGDAALNKLLGELRAAGVPVKHVPAVKLNKLFSGAHQNIVAYVAPVPFVPLEQAVRQAFERHKSPVFVLLDGITDTRNLGAVLRSAAAFEAGAVILPAHGSAGITEETVKSSAGGIFKVDLVRVPHLLDAVYFLQSEGVAVVAATEKSSDYLENHRFDGPAAVILGNEQKGIGKRLLQAADARLRIAISPQMDSLNVSVAAGIFLYEMHRQRMQAGDYSK